MRWKRRRERDGGRDEKNLYRNGQSGRQPGNTIRGGGGIQ